MMARQGLDRVQVIAAARDLVNAKGLDALTMRALSAALGVEAPSLYGHVKDKADILDGLAELVYSEVYVPATRDEWPRRIQLYCNGFRRALLKNPNLASLVATRPVLSLSTLDIIESGLAEMRQHGLSVEQATFAFDTIASFVTGHVLFELTSTEQTKVMGGHDPARLASARAALPADRYPNVRLALGTTIDRTAEFNFGVSLIVEGLRPLVERQQPEHNLSGPNVPRTAGGATFRR